MKFTFIVFILLLSINNYGQQTVQKSEVIDAKIELYGLETEYDLSRNLGFATKNITPLDNKGSQQWPKTGDNADIVLIDASCSAEAVARMSPVLALAHKGNLVWKN